MSGVQVELRIAGVAVVNAEPYVRAGNVARVPRKIVAAPTLLDADNSVSAELSCRRSADDLGHSVIVHDGRDAVGVVEFVVCTGISQ